MQIVSSTRRLSGSLIRVGVAPGGGGREAPVVAGSWGKGRSLRSLVPAKCHAASYPCCPVVTFTIVIIWWSCVVTYSSNVPQDINVNSHLSNSWDICPDIIGWGTCTEFQNFHYMKVISNTYITNELIIERWSPYSKKLVRVLLSIFAVNHPTMSEDNFNFSFCFMYYS